MVVVVVIFFLAIASFHLVEGLGICAITAAAPGEWDGVNFVV